MLKLCVFKRAINISGVRYDEYRYRINVIITFQTH